MILPVQLFDTLNCTNKETMEKSIASIETVFNKYKENVASNHKFVGHVHGKVLVAFTEMYTDELVDGKVG